MGTLHSNSDAKTKTSSGGLFLNRRDVVLALCAQSIICSPALIVAWWLRTKLGADIFTTVVIFWLAMMLSAIAFLWVLRTLFPMRPGRYDYADRPVTIYVWTLNSFVCATNLGIIYNHPSLLPSPIKKVFYTLLGAKLAKGPMMIGGRLTDPHLITIEAGALIGGDCSLLAHAMTRFEGNVLILEPIVIRRGAIVGTLSLVMPGVTVGENATIRAMSYVPMRTNIPAGEIWGGNPAVRRPARKAAN